MKTKSFIIFLVAIICTTITLIMFGGDQSSLQNIVSETHKQLNNLKNLKETIQEVETKKFNVDPTYLEVLGFTEKPNLYPEVKLDSAVVPLIVTAGGSGDGEMAVGFVKNVQNLLKDHFVHVYNLGMSAYEIELLYRICNSSKCAILDFPFDKFPDYVGSLKFHAYRPLIIQLSLDSAGVVLWLDVDHRFTVQNFTSYMASAERMGILAWTIQQPTSSLTHPSTFEYFAVTQKSFYFHRMVSSSYLLVMNTPRIHQLVMLPWVKCVLTFECLSPIGAQVSGCKFDKKPMYRYSGCHRYDQSALNIVLGLAFNFSYYDYTNNSLQAFFRRSSEEWVSLSSPQANITLES